MFVLNSFLATYPVSYPKTRSVTKCDPAQINCNLARGRAGGCKSCPASASCRKQSANGKTFEEVFERKGRHLDIRV